jgi:hypothetical protein
MGREKGTKPPSSKSRFGRRKPDVVESSKSRFGRRKPDVVEEAKAPPVQRLKPKAPTAAKKPVVKPPPPPEPAPVAAREVTPAELVRKNMERFWGEGPGTNAQLSELGGLLRALPKEQVELLSAIIPPDLPGTVLGGRVMRLKALVHGVLSRQPTAGA